MNNRKLPSGWAYRRALAVRYFPDVQERIAVARLHRWIMSDPEFHTALTRKGYRPRMRAFPPPMMQVFRKYMG